MARKLLDLLEHQYRHARDSRLCSRVAVHPVFVVLSAVFFPGICIFVFLTARFSFDIFRHNDYDVLPYAKQFINPDWLASDWYLNLKIGYRYAFNTIAGTLCDSFSFDFAKTMGRTLVALLMAVCFTALQRALRMYALLIVPVLLYFIQEQSFFADESFLLRFEAKCFAYGCAILAMAFLFRSRYKLMLGSLGAALSFHVLVGIYAGFCTAWVIVFTSEHRRNWKVLLKNSYFFFLLGFLGVYAVLYQLFSASALDPGDALTASNIYAIMRVPHHVYPPSFGPVDVWGVELLVRSWPLLIPLFWGSSALRQFSIYILSSLMLAGIGMALFHLGQTHLLKYYWFRYPATMIPLGSCVVIAAMASLAYQRAMAFASGSRRALKWVSVAVGVIVSVALLAVNARILYHPQMVTTPGFVPGSSIVDIARAPIHKDIRHPLRDWILNNTSADDVFLVDPVMDSFYVAAERARVVSFKHSPQSEEDILEWHRRLLDISGLETIDQKGFACSSVLRRGYCQLSEDHIRNLAKKYNVRYLVHRGCKRRLSFPIVFRKWRYTIYSLEGGAG